MNNEDFRNGFISFNDLTTLEVILFSAIPLIILTLILLTLNNLKPNDKYFHIKPDGSLAYDQKFDKIDSFSEGLAAIELDGKQFHIKPDGSPAYKQRFDRVNAFSEGLASVKLDGKWFNINPDGSRVD